MVSVCGNGGAGTPPRKLDPPGAINTVANAVSGNNAVGSYFDGSTDRAFLYNGSTYTTLDGPGGSAQWAPS